MHSVKSKHREETLRNENRRPLKSPTINILEADIGPTPDFDAILAKDYVLGMGKIKGSVKTLLDIEKVLVAEAADQICQASSNN